MAAITLNPMTTTAARNVFYVESDGYIQGIAMDDPANRFNLASGFADKELRLPLWGGVAISEFLAGDQSRPRGSMIRRAITPGEITGFTVFNQAHNGITSPASPVPQFGPNMSVSFYRFGSNMRVPVKCSPGVVALATRQATIEQELAWDFANQQIALAEELLGTEFPTTAGAIASTGTRTISIVLDSPTEDPVPGQFLILCKSGTATPGPSLNAYTGVCAVLSYNPSTNMLVCTDPKPNYESEDGKVQIAKVSPNYDSMVSLDVKLLGVQAGNSKTCKYDETTGNLTWEYGSNCALLLL